MTTLASTSHRWDRLVRPGGRYYLLALSFFVAVFGIIPFSINAHSGEDWEFPFSELLPVAALGLAAFLGTAVLIRLVAALHARTASTVAVALFCLGLFLLLAHVYAPIQIGPLDGTAIKSTEPIVYSLVELAFLVGAIVVFVLLQRGRGVWVAASFSVVSLLVAIGYAVVLTSLDRTVSAMAEAPAMRAPTASSSDIDGNLYQILLDRMQTEVFLHALEKTGTADVFAGFDLFKNNISNYVWTLQSAASYFTGTYFDGRDYDKWVAGWRDGGLLPALADRGYRLWMYSAIKGWNNRYTSVYQNNLDIYGEETGFAGAGIYDLLQIWLASLAPNFLTNEALPLAARLADPTFTLLTGRLRPLSGVEGLHTYASVLMLRRLAREESQRAPNGEYVYAHALLPHGPHVFDPDCRYVGPPGQRPVPLRTREAHLLQAECAVSLVASFLRELKRLGRYEAATIVIHGDTGDWISFGDTHERPGRILGYPQRSLLAYVQALLMFKRPHADGRLRLVETPTQLVDLYPTLLDVLKLSPSGPNLDGHAIYSAAIDAPRTTPVAFDPKAPNLQGSNLMEVLIEDPLDLPGSKLTVVGPVGDGAPRRHDGGGK